MKHHFKQVIFAAFSSALVFLSQSAQADFRKALDAYIARDGVTMLKEVKHAVDTKNCDGLMLFLMATNMDAATSDYDAKTKPSKSTLRAILPREKWGEMYQLLIKATNNSTLDSQYYLLTNSQFKKPYKQHKKITDEYIKKGSRLAKLNSNQLVLRAEAGDPESQLELGLDYLNSQNTNRDEGKGYYWLMHAAESYEVEGRGDVDIYAGKICDYLQTSASEDIAKLREAYLWCRFGVNEKVPSNAGHALAKMRSSGALKVVAPKVDSDWGKESAYSLIQKDDEHKLPNWIVRAREDVLQKNAPIFTYYLSDRSGMKLDVYAGGEVLIQVGHTNKNARGLLMKVSPETIQKLFKDIKLLGFYEWHLLETYPTNEYPRACDLNCENRTEMVVTIRQGNTTKRVVLSDFFVEDLDSNSLSVSKMSRYEKDTAKRMIEKFKKTNVNSRLAKLKVLVDKYFPTQHLICGVGGSEKGRAKCINRNKFWEDITKL